MRSRARKAQGPIHPTFGEKVRYWREDRGFGVNELADAAGISHSLVSAWEHGKTNPGYANACKVAEVLRIHVSALWDHSPAPNAQPSRA